jgi:hypothetical protein
MFTFLNYHSHRRLIENFKYKTNVFGTKNYDAYLLKMCSFEGPRFSRARQRQLFAELKEGHGILN